MSPIGFNGRGMPCQWGWAQIIYRERAGNPVGANAGDVLVHSIRHHAFQGDATVVHINLNRSAALSFPLCCGLSAPPQTRMREVIPTAYSLLLQSGILQVLAYKQVQETLASH
jgi:hypothetical protein